MKILPFFVYGTLLPGQPNYYLWSDNIVEQKPAVFSDGRLFDLGAYPMLIEGDGGPVVGQLVSIRPADYPLVLRRLDELEGYDPQNPENSDYRRHERFVHLEDGRKKNAWIYLGHQVATAKASVIPSGNWLTHSLAKEQEIAEWWALFRFGKSG